MPNYLSFKPISRSIAVLLIMIVMGKWSQSRAAEPSVIAGGGRHLMLLHKGTLLAAGSHNSGQLGHSLLPATNLLTLVPVELPQDDMDWQEVAAGWRHSLALASDGKLWATGRNYDGQLGDGTQQDRWSWVLVGKEAEWSRVAAGERHSLGVRSDGSLWSWGWNQRGQLGLNMTNLVLTPQRVGERREWREVAAGLTHSLAIRADGSLWSWGQSRWGALGQQDTRSSLVPVRVGQDHDWMRVAAGARHSLAVKRDGSLWGWGDNGFGQVGDGSEAKVLWTPVRIGKASNWTLVAAGERHSIALNADRKIWTWGGRDFGQLGSESRTASRVPIPLELDETWSSIAAGNDFCAALAQDGQLWLWGTMVEPRPDQNVDTKPVVLPVASPQLVKMLKEHAVAAVVEETARLGKRPLSQILAAGEYHGAFITPDGSLWSWGINAAGQLGDGTHQVRSRPIQIGAPGIWAGVAAGERHTVAIKRDGTLWSWGANDLGQLGQQHQPNTTQPMQVGTGQTWYAVSCGAGHTLALKQNGALWSWGWNSSGQVGNFATKDALEPIAVAIGETSRTALPDRNWNSIAAGREFSLALRRKGLWGWGLNESGQLSINARGKLPNKYSPTRIDAADQWQQVSAGGAHALGIQKDGSLWAWGKNKSGQLGNGSTEGAVKPVRIGEARWSRAAAGGSHSMAIRHDGSLWAWGRNSEGQLGYFTLADEYEPLMVNQATNWVEVVAGRSHTMALKADGSVWAWGSWSASELEVSGGAITFGGCISE